MKLCIVMPAYNESACIEPVAKAWLALIKEWKQKTNGTAQLVVVNDGSRDNTGALLDGVAKVDADLKVIHQANAGHGAAVMRGYKEALAMGADFIFQTDSDDQFKPKDFWQLWDVRSSSRFITGFREVRSDALHRLVITKIMLLLNAFVFGVYLRDANIPYRLMDAKFLQKLLTLFPADVFAPNIFLAVLAKKIGCDLYEFPITHVERQTGNVSIVRWKLIKICFRCVRELLQFRWSMITQRAQLQDLRAQSA